MNGGLLRRIEKVESAVVGSGDIPQAKRVQVIEGRMDEGRFIPNDPKDSSERRKELLTQRYGPAAAEKVLFIELINFFGKAGPSGNQIQEV